MANQFSESLNESPVLQKIIIMFAIIVAPIYFYTHYSYNPNASRISKVFNQIVKLQAASNRLPLVRKRLVEYKQQLNELSKSLPNKKEIPNLVNKIVRLAYKNGIIVNRFNPSLKHTGKFYNTVNINLDLFSNYSSLGKFISDLSNEKRLIVPGSITIRNAKTTASKRVIAHISLQLSTYYFSKHRK